MGLRAGGLSSFSSFARNDDSIMKLTIRRNNSMITLSLLLIAILLIIVIAICFIIASPIAIILLLALVLDVAVLGGIFGRRKHRKED